MLTYEPTRRVSEAEFKSAVEAIVDRGEYPSPGRIERELGQPITHNLNGRRCRWREQVLQSRGWTHRINARPRAWTSTAWDRRVPS